ncbi:MAG: VCBS repeat-containing protein [Polyangiaceae bacterium]
MRTISKFTIAALASVCLAPVLAGITSCADLTPLVSGTCGNGVIDANEDCDGNDPLCGKAGEAFACRRKCDTSQTATAACPSGWGCGIDGICREPTGNFSSAGDSLSAGVFSMQVGDFDGDGRKDILGTSARSASGTALRFHYFGESASLVEAKTLSAGAASPFVSDLDGDSRDDVVFGWSGIAVFRGSANRELLPSVVNSASIAKRGYFGAFSMTSLRGEFVFPTGTKTALIGLRRDDPNSPSSPTALVSLLDGQPLTDAQVLAGQPVWTSFDGHQPQGSPCGEVVVGGPNSIAILRPACGDPKAPNLNWKATAIAQVLPTPGLSAFFVGDLNNDKRLDILAVRGGKLFGYLNVVPNVGGPAFDPSKLMDVIPADLGEVPRSSSDAGAADRVPLALADINNDGYGDLVMPYGIFIATAPVVSPDPKGTWVYPALRNIEPRLELWNQVRMGDVNGDGLPDIVATTGADSSSQIEVLLAYRTTLGADTTPFRLSTDGTVNKDNLAVGDFDGDGADDIAAIFKTTEGEESIGIAFGRGFGSPEPFRTVANYPFAKGIFTLPSATEGRRRGIVLTAEPPVSNGPNNTNIAELATTGDRVSISPLLLRSTTETSTVVWSPTQLGGGTFNVKDPLDPSKPAAAARIVLALARGFTGGESKFASAFVSRLDTDGQLTAAEQAIKRVGECFKTAGAAPNANVDDPVSVIGRLVGTTDSLFSLTAQKDAISISSVTATDGACTATVLGTIPGVRDLTNESAIRIVDIDADGKNDLVVLHAQAGDLRNLYVFFGNGSGGVSPPVKVPVPGTTGDAGASSTASSSIVGFAKVRGKVSSGPSFVIATRTRLMLMQANADHTFTLAQELTGLVNQEGDSEEGSGKKAWLQRGSDVVAGDFDGDGIEDLAIANSGTLRILRQLPVRK